MSPDLILIVVLAVFLVLLLSECPVAFSLAASGALGIFLMRDVSIVTAQFASSPFNATARYSLAIIPMYILLGMFALQGKLAPRVYVIADRVFARLPGGLGIATVGACAGFAAVTGSSVATAATIGRISVTEMRKHGYPVAFASGIVAAAGTLGVLIPPSIVLVLYGILANESIGQLLLAGIVPGLFSAGMYMGWILLRGRALVGVDKRHDLADVLADVSAVGSSTTGVAADRMTDAGTDLSAGESDDTAPPETGFALLRTVLWVITIFAVILLGVYTGQFTVIESGALGALLALVMLVVETGREGVARTWARIRISLLDTAATTSMAFAILVGATIFSFYLVLARVPMRFTNWVIELDASPMVVIIILLLALIPLGMALETLSVLIIVVPLVHPIVTGLGFEGIWFAILFVKMIEIGLVTPPVGMNCYIVGGAARVPAEQVFRGVGPFVVIDLVTIALLLMFPSIVTWLPSITGA